MAGWVVGGQQNLWPDDDLANTWDAKRQHRDLSREVFEDLLLVLGRVFAKNEVSYNIVGAELQSQRLNSLSKDAV